MRIPQIDINPLRVLGVYANSTLREIEQNKAQLRAFARVGQKVELPLWLRGLTLLPPMSDVTEEMVTQAQSQISLQDDRDNYARFWFEHNESLAKEDEQVFSLLCNNQVDEACQLLQQRTDHAAMKNLLLLSVMKDDWTQIADCASKCFEGDLMEFRLFMDAVVKASDRANGEDSNQLLDYFNDESWRAEMSKVLTNNHKQLMEGLLDSLKHVPTDNAKLLKKAYDNAMVDRKHLIAICNLNGEESLVYQFYISEFGKMLCITLYRYAKLQPYHAHELRWICAEFLTWWFFVKEEDPDYPSLRSMHAYINSVLPRYGGGSRSSDDRVTPTINIDGKDNSGCTVPAVIIGFLIFIFAFSSGGGSKKAKTYDYNLNNVTKKYNYSLPENFQTPVDVSAYIDDALKQYQTSAQSLSVDELNQILANVNHNSDAHRKQVPKLTDSLTLKPADIIKIIDSLNTNADTIKIVDTLKTKADTIKIVDTLNTKADAIKNADSLKNLIENLPAAFEYQEVTDSITTQK